MQVTRKLKVITNRRVLGFKLREVPRVGSSPRDVSQDGMFVVSAHIM